MKDNKYLIVIAGPTAVGKTDLCINLAKKFNTEIISSDSRQFFKETILGTAKPSDLQLSEVPHHFINSLSIHDNYDVKSFEEDALNLMQEIFQKHNIIIMTGGSGLYIDAICKGFDDMPQVGSEIRQKIIKEYELKGLVFLQEEVKLLDPEYFALVDQNNPQRLMRALEVCRGTGKPFSSFRNKKKVDRPFNIIKIGLEREREELYRRIDLRMDLMIQEGLFEEAVSLFPHKHLNALQTVGYSEIFGFLDGNYDKEEAIRLLKRNSRRYAKRQLTWFKRDTEMTWFHPDQLEKVLEFISIQMA
ncbi:tRNA (adenosine(37)-N6)-dimethylallyltransferase MiaA [Belliella aquatica]|uniref:tRNA dimethylallyltransferase n=1 Tax=Belliella aquatica TaxID=1323734 RepID=A0ABQ1MYJ4_9BACT|nr:tRNA (adenosine(37)-N6)-dimethylallyltransferase MiaA [Belliella aquatica]MCH7406709.1 tRNA (adenosine(37)-N6)-dimethylallyltransferase MiaA [Belliella aquatica]GGC49118.1 tRNA dimethylallyltransferase 1 [Belliella aquatica]